MRQARTLSAWFLQLKGCGPPCKTIHTRQPIPRRPVPRLTSGNAFSWQPLRTLLGGKVHLLSSYVACPSSDGQSGATLLLTSLRPQEHCPRRRRQLHRQSLVSLSVASNQAYQILKYSFNEAFSICWSAIYLSTHPSCRSVLAKGIWNDL